MARKPQPKALTRAQVAAMNDDELTRRASAAGKLALVVGFNPKHERMTRRLIADHDLCMSELSRRERQP